MCDLKTSDINLDKRNILVRSGKGDRDRVVMISRECGEILQEYIKKYKKAYDDYLFRNVANNNKITRERVTKILKKLAKEVGIEKRVFPHLLRHSLATNLLANGCDIYHIQQQLGHSDIRTTMIYVHSNTKMLKEQYDEHCPKYILPKENKIRREMSIFNRVNGNFFNKHNGFSVGNRNVMLKPDGLKRLIQSIGMDYKHFTSSLNH